MYHFFSTVIPGLGVGKKLGFPTANLQIPPDFKLPYGVYAVAVEVKGQTYKGALHYGERTIINKEFPDKSSQKWISLEVHILDFQDNILGQPVQVGILKKIREVREFTRWQKLKGQIDRDIRKIEGLPLKPNV